MRVIQVTDLHVVPKPGTKLYGLDTYKSLERVLTAALLEPVKPDLIIATGDLTEDGSEISYRRVQTLLSGTGIAALVLPGNHDSVENMAAALVGGAISMPMTHREGDWGYVLLNSQVPGAGHGEVRSAELRALEAQLREAPNTPFLVALHHTPLTPCPYAGCRLERREALFEVIDRHKNLRCVISGHAHEDRERTRGNALIMTTPATSAQAWHAQEGASSNPDSFWASHYFDPSRSAYRSIDLYPDGRVSSEVHWVFNT